MLRTILFSHAAKWPSDPRARTTRPHCRRRQRTHLTGPVAALKAIGVLLAISMLAGCGGSPVLSAQPPAIIAHATPTIALGQGVVGVRLFVEPDDGKRLLTRPIRAARHTIDLTMYLLTDHTLIHDLEYANAKGVRVRVLLEHYPFGSGGGTGANQSAYDQLYAANIPVRWTSTRFRLTHEKTMIVDSATAYILTTNYTKSAFKSNREFGVVDNIAADVREAGSIFAADWRGVPYAARDPNLLVSPLNSRSGLLSLLKRARHTVLVYAEEVQDGGIEAALVAAQRRGALVRVISNAGDATNAVGLAVLRRGGVRIRLLHAPYIHAKAIVVDGRWAFVGSENLSHTSLDLNRELGILLADQDAIARLTAIFDQDWSGIAQAP